MSVLFEPTEINGMKLLNRFIRSATWEGMATAEGAGTPALTAEMVRLAEGRVNLIRRWESGDHRPALCLSDNQCFKPAMAGEGLYCVVEKKKKG